MDVTIIITSLFLLYGNFLVDSLLFQSSHWCGQQWGSSLVSWQGVHEALWGQDSDVQITRQEEEHQHPGDHHVSDQDTWQSPADDDIIREAHDDSPISEEDKQRDFFISEEQYNPQLMPHTGRLPEPEKFVRNMQV